MTRAQELAQTVWERRAGSYKALDELVALAEDGERAREALREIAEFPDGFGYPAAQEIARAALGERP